MQGSSAAYEQDLRWLGASPVGRFSVVTSGFGFIHWGHFDVAVSPFALYVATARGRYRAYVRQDDRALPIRGLPGTIRVPGAYEEGDKLCVALKPLIGPASMRISGMPPELRRYVVGVLGEAPLEVRPRRTRRWELYAYLPIALLGVVLLPAFGGPGDDGGGLFAQVVLAALGAGMLALLPPHMPPLARAVLGPATLGVLAAPVLLLRALPFQTFAFTPFLAAMLLLTGALLGARFRILAAIPAFFAVLLGIWGAFAIAGSLEVERLFSRDPAEIAEVTFTRDGERRTLRDPAAIAAYSRALGASRPFSRGRSRPCAPWQVEVRDRAGGVARFELGRSPASARDAWLEVRGRTYRNGALAPRLDALGLPLLQGDCTR